MYLFADWLAHSVLIVAAGKRGGLLSYEHVQYMGG